MYSWIFNSFTYWFIPYLLIESHSQQVFSRHWNKAVNKKDHGAHILVGNIVSNTSNSVQFSSVQLLSHVQLFVTPWIAAHHAPLSSTNSHSSLKLMSTVLVILSSPLILGYPILLPPTPPSIRVFSNESTFRMRWPKYWSFSFSIIPSK